MSIDLGGGNIFVIKRFLRNTHIAGQNGSKASTPTRTKTRQSECRCYVPKSILTDHLSITILMSLVLIAHLLVNPLFPVDVFGLWRGSEHPVNARLLAPSCLVVAGRY